MTPRLKEYKDRHHENKVDAYPVHNVYLNTFLSTLDLGKRIKWAEKTTTFPLNHYPIGEAEQTDILDHDVTNGDPADTDA